MPLKLDFAVENPTLSAHEGLRVGCRLRNDDAEARELPSPYDRSGAFRIELRDGGERLLRTMSRLTRQAVMTGGRIDRSLSLDTLAPGQEWSWKMDLASFAGPIPAGDFVLSAALDYPPGSVSLQTGLQPIRVQRDPLASIAALRDNPVLDGLALLIETEREGGPEYFLRHHNYARPLGAWYSSRILEGENAEAPFCASSNFRQTDSLDPFFQVWVIWTSAGQLRARRFDRGAATDLFRSVPIPEGRTLLRSAFRTASGELFLFFWSPAGMLECYRWDQRLEMAFQIRLRVSNAPVSIGADEEFIHLAVPWRGILYRRLSYSGRSREVVHAYRSRLQPASLTYDPAGRRIKGLFRDGPHGKIVRMAVVDLARDVVAEWGIEVPLRGLRELSFDQDREGQFHLLASTAARKLYHFKEGASPKLIAEGEDAFFPLVAASGGVFLGCYRTNYGYGFLQAKKRGAGP